MTKRRYGKYRKSYSKYKFPSHQMTHRSQKSREPLYALKLNYWDKPKSKERLLPNVRKVRNQRVNIQNMDFPAIVNENENENETDNNNDNNSNNENDYNDYDNNNNNENDYNNYDNDNMDEDFDRVAGKPVNIRKYDKDYVEIYVNKISKKNRQNLFRKKKKTCKRNYVLLDDPESDLCNPIVKQVYMSNEPTPKPYIVLGNSQVPLGSLLIRGKYRNVADYLTLVPENANPIPEKLTKIDHNVKDEQKLKDLIKEDLNLKPNTQVSIAEVMQSNESINNNKNVSSKENEKEILYNDILALNLTNEEINIAKSALDEADSTTTQVQPNLSQSDLNRLKPGQWLNDAVIDYFFTVFMRNRDNEKVKRNLQAVPSVYFSYNFLNNLMNVNKTSIGSITLITNLSQYNRANAYKAVKTFRILKNNIFNKSKLFLPLNINRSHWSMYMIDMINKTINYFDSIEPSTESKLESVSVQNIRYQVLLNFLEDRSKDEEGVKDFDVDEWSYNVFYEKQNNGYDCGIYTITNAQLLSENLTGEEVVNKIQNLNKSNKRLQCAYQLKTNTYNFPFV